MATYVASDKRILVCGLNIDCLLVGLSSYQFRSDFFSENLLVLLEALRLNDNRFVWHIGKFARLQFARFFELSTSVSL